MKTIAEITVVVLILGMILFQNMNLMNRVSPVICQQEFKNQLQAATIATGMGDPGQKVLQAVTVASKQTGLTEPFIIALMYTESSFKKNAVSSKNYRGLMQIPQNVHYEDANCIIGSKIFLEKLQLAGGDYRKAISLYKGWGLHPEGYKHADRVLNLTNKLKERMG